MYEPGITKHQLTAQRRWQAKAVSHLAMIGRFVASDSAPAAAYISTAVIHLMFHVLSSIDINHLQI
jgi:hypothetical protein